MGGGQSRVHHSCVVVPASSVGEEEKVGRLCSVKWLDHMQYVEVLVSTEEPKPLDKP